MQSIIKNKIIEIEKSSNFKAIPGKLSIWIKMKSNKDVYDFLINDKNNFGDDFLQRLYNIRYDIKDWPKCSICGNKVNEFIGYNKGYKKTCCRKCTNISKYGVEHPMQCKNVQENLKKSILEKYGVENAYQADEIKEKIKKTNFKKYGVENPRQSKEIQEKIKQTNLKKYGSESPLGSNVIREKIKETNVERFGVDSPLASEQIWDKIKQTNLKKYGVEYAIQNNKVREKQKKTNFEKYGVENILQSREMHEKIKQTCLEKYGVETPLKSKEIRDKTMQTSLKKYGAKIYSKSKDFLINSFNEFKDKIKEYIIPMFDENEYEGLRSDKKLKWKCAKCGNEFEQSLKDSRVPLKESKYQYIPRCWKCFPHLTNISSSENELYEFCRSLFNDTIRNDKRLIGIDLDIVIPSLKIALEFDGIYYHSTQFKKQGLHLKKTVKCNELGYRLIHIWEDQWINDKESIKERLKKAFDNKEENDFNENEMTLDRSWFNGMTFNRYKIIETIPPKIVKRLKFDVEDCGQLKIRKMQ